MAGILTATAAISSDGTYFIFTDTTGAYDASSNPGGYGGPNPTVGDYLTYSISVVPPDPDTLLATGTPVVIDAYPDLPSISNGTFDITSLLLTGVADQILAEGWWQFNVTATWDNGDSGEYTVTVNMINYRTTKCCIDNLIVESAACNCSGGSRKMRNLAKAVTYLWALTPKVVNDEVAQSPVDDCTQYNAGVEMLLQLQDICELENCEGCNGCN